LARRIFAHLILHNFTFLLFKGALLLLTLLFVIVAVAYGIYWFLVLRHYEETDEARRIFAHLILHNFTFLLFHIG
jgi:hypothetical protein